MREDPLARSRICHWIDVLVFLVATGLEDLVTLAMSVIVVARVLFLVLLV